VNGSARAAKPSLQAVGAPQLLHTSTRNSAPPQSRPRNQYLPPAPRRPHGSEYQTNQNSDGGGGARAQRPLQHISLGPLPDMRENPLDQRRAFNARNDLEPRNGSLAIVGKLAGFEAAISAGTLVSRPHLRRT